MTPRRVRIDQRAAEEMDAAADWYESHRTGLGLVFVNAVDESIRIVADSPGVGSPFRELKRSRTIRRFLVSKFPYALVYLDAVEEIVVLAVAHCHRRPGYWRDRAPG